MTVTSFVRVRSTVQDHLSLSLIDWSVLRTRVAPDAERPDFVTTPSVVTSNISHHRQRGVRLVLRLPRVWQPFLPGAVARVG